MYICGNKNEMSQKTSLMERVNCPGCGADMIYNPEKERLFCENCGSTRPIPAQNIKIQRINVEEGLKMREEETLDLNKEKVVNCQSCGATFTISTLEASIECSFCGARNTVSQNFSERVIKPQGVIPFKIGRKKASEIIRKWLGSGFFTPSSLQKASRIEEVKGVYVPTWIFDIALSANYQVEIGTYYYETKTYTDSQGKTQTRKVRKTRWRYYSGHRSGDYSDIPVLGVSKGLKTKHFDKIAQFSYQTAKEFDSRFLLGFESVIYDKDLSRSFDEGKDKAEKKLEQEIISSLPGDTYRNFHMDARVSYAFFKHLLLPVWVVSYLYKGKNYQVLVNGENGKIAGQKPVSTWKVLLVIISIILLGILIYFLVKK